MAKQAYEYFKVNPWKISEEGFNQERNRVAESIFSLANEYMGVRGFMEEGVSCDTLLGSYFNGIYENAVKDNETHYKGIVKRTHFMVNSVNWLYTRILIDGELLDVNQMAIKHFRRELDFRTGELVREFTVQTTLGKQVHFVFKRFLSMTSPHYGYQQIEIQALDDDIQIDLTSGLDYSIIHWGKFKFWNLAQHECGINCASAVGKTQTTNQRVYSSYKLNTNLDVTWTSFVDHDLVGHQTNFTVKKGTAFACVKNVTHLVDKTGNMSDFWTKGKTLTYDQKPYQEMFERNVAYWDQVWHDFDIEIKGDEKNQQGIRFCIYQLQQTYHGVDPSNNIGAKGLTGEAYSGHAFWDTETYCLPFFIFNNPNAAKNLLMFRYNTLNQARSRAKDLDCKGACYPIATLNGNEGCDLWQHASLQFQPSTGVAYGVFHYVNNTHDFDFLYNYGLEMLIEISRFLISRGDWNATHSKFGFYGVMGPDEFQMMVNHNCYTNYMAKKTLEYTLEVLTELKQQNPALYAEKLVQYHITEDELLRYQAIEQAMYIPYQQETKRFEQHEGYFDLPHIDVDAIPVSDFPLYSHWSYDRIYRNDMIKQPDVLMFMFLYNQQFTLEEKQANYDFYEPRCIHESSLSPSIHSVFASELNRVEEAVNFFGFATRMDIDDYNRNASEGLHTTSIAAAWINIVYGFGGFRSDGKDLVLNPVIPTMWESYSFQFKSRDSLIKVNVTKKDVTITCDNGQSDLIVYGKKVTVQQTPLILPIKIA